jgi:hypothetical protein
MKKLKKLAKGIFLLIRKPYLINNVLNADLALEAEFNAHFPEVNPTRQISMDSIHVVSDVITISPISFLSGSSLVTDFLLLKLACLRTKAKHYLEIGTWRGESVANVSEIVEHCYTLNLSDEDLEHMNLPQTYIHSHRFFSSEKKNVTHVYGNSETFEYETLNTKFDVIFIDGDHHAEAVEADTRRLLPFLKSTESILIWHDAKSDTETPRYEVLMGIYKGIPKEKHKNIYLVENTLCAVYIQEDIEASQLVKYTKPTHYFELDVRIKH